MLGHLKAEDFINLMEGAEPPTTHKVHLDSCARCREVWESLKPLYAGVTSLDGEVPEPDWVEFRSSVRNELLSRSVQRQTVVRRWTGWAIPPAVAWALSLLLAVGIPTGAFVWHLQKESRGSATAQATRPLPASQLIEAGAEKTVFDEMIELNDSEQAQFQQLLEAAQNGAQRLR
jgi:hypothetical protein